MRNCVWEVVQLLIQHGANLHCRFEEGMDALQAASQAGYVEVVELLIRHGAHVDAAGLQSPLVWALRVASGGGHAAVVQLLLQHGADVNARGDDDDPTLKVAAE